MRKLFILFIILSAACKESYVPPTSATNKSLLVVEGFINNGPDSMYFTLSHTFNIGVDDTTNVNPELHAQLHVEGKDNSSYALAELGAGKYGAPGLSLNNALQYRLHIHTSTGKDYVSDYVDLKSSPIIDSVSWKNASDGVHFSVSSHDPQHASHYYRWEYTETWQYNAIYYSNYIYVNHQIEVRNPNDIYTCWRTDQSAGIFLGSSAALAQDQVYEVPLVIVPENSWEISVKYSILVKQYVLTADAYAFWQNLQKNTEQIGSIFSPEPSTAVGNIHNSQDTSEQVIGYVSAGTMQQKRIFVTPDQINNWFIEGYPAGCMDPGILRSTPNNPDSLAHYLSGPGFLAIDSLGLPPSVRYSYAERACVDCTIFGTNIKPSFWQ